MGEARTQLIELVVEHVARDLSALSTSTAGDVYAISLHAEVDDDLATPPLLTLAWNTEARYREVDRIAKGRLPLNSRWNTGTWLDFGHPLDHERFGDLAQQALSECGLGSPQPDPETDEGGERWVAIRNATRAFIADVARAMHERGILERMLGHDVIVLCRAGSDSDPWTQLTLDANPPELHDNFKDFHDTEGAQG